MSVGPSVRIMILIRIPVNYSKNCKESLKIVGKYEETDGRETCQQKNMNLDLSKIIRNCAI